MRWFPLLLVLAGLGCLMPGARAQEGEMAGGEAGESRPATDEQKARLGALLPAPADVGATADGERVFYTGDLFDYIDGAAPAYFDFGFQCLAHQGYKAGGIELKADVYDMGTLLHAFAIYAAERSETKMPAVDAGAEGFAGEALLYFYQDRYYVKLETFGKDAAAANALLRKTAGEITKRIGANRKTPPELALLPAAAMVARSQGFNPKAPLAMESLAPALRARYRLDDQETTLWVSLAGSAAEAKARAAKLRGRVEAASAKDRADLGEGAFEGTGPYIGRVLVVPQGKQLVILVDPPGDPLPLLKACAEAAGK